MTDAQSFPDQCSRKICDGEFAGPASCACSCGAGAEVRRLRAENEALKVEGKRFAADVNQRLDWIVRDRREPDKVLVNTSTVRSVLIRYVTSDETEAMNG